MHLSTSFTTLNLQFSVEEQALFFAKEARENEEFTLTKKKYPDIAATVIFQDGEKPFSLTDLVYLGSHSLFVFTQLENGGPIHLPLCSSHTVRKIASLLKGRKVWFLPELTSLMESVRYLSIDEKAMRLFMPIYSQLSFKNLILYMDLFANNNDVDIILAQNLQIQNIARYYRESTQKVSIFNSQELRASTHAEIDRQLAAILTRFRNRTNSRVHGEFRRAFSPLLINAIAIGTLNSRLLRLMPPIELTVTPENIFLLDREEIFRSLTHCKIAKGPKSFYLQVLEKLSNSVTFSNLTLEKGNFLEITQNEYKDNETVVRAAVQTNGVELQFASQRLRDDALTVFLAVRQRGISLQFASHRLKNDEQIVLTAIKQNWAAFDYASEEMQNNLEIRKTLTEHWSYISAYSGELRSFLLSRNLQ